MRVPASSFVCDIVVMAAAIATLPFVWGGSGSTLLSSDGWTGSSDFGRILKPLDDVAATNPPFTTATTRAEQFCPFETVDDDDDEGSRRLVSASPAIISNGVIKLGVNPFGNLNVPGTIPVYNGIETRVGLRFIQQVPGGGQIESEATSFGCECEVRIFMISFTPV